VNKTGSKTSKKVRCLCNAIVSAKIETIKVNAPRDISDKRLELSVGVDRSVEIRSKAGFSEKNNINDNVNIFNCASFFVDEFW
jgi:hypothetical protein